MTRITSVSEKMKLKLSLGDYPVLNSTESPLQQTEPLQEPIASEKQSKGRKIYQIPKQDMAKLEELFRKRLSTEKESSISSIMSEAIHLLYSRESS